MNFFKSQVSSAGPKRQRSLKAVPILALLCATVVIGRAFVVMHAKLKLSALDVLRTKHERCEEHCRPSGTEALPKGIVSSISDFEFRPLWGSPVEKKLDMNLLAMAVGKKQKANVDSTVRKFLNDDFSVVLFHYDGNVDDWKDLEWSAQALHIAAGKQTKWWFAKRFLHPDIVAKYSYIFLWDEDLGVQNFNVRRCPILAKFSMVLWGIVLVFASYSLQRLRSYLSVVKKEGLEISQPAIDARKSKEYHHQLTLRQRGTLVHRRYHGPIGRIKCDENSVEPPCTGWVEMMAPVFSRAAWRCTWYMIQNDLVHAWGVDFQFGYCAQGDRTQNIGIVDSDYIIHYGVKTLGDTAANKVAESPGALNIRDAVRNQSYADLDVFKNRWKKAVEDDECWTDPFSQPRKQWS